MNEPSLPAVLLTGAPASGKTTLGRLLAGRLTAAVFDQDVATGPLVDVVGRLMGVQDLDDPRLADLTRRARYEVLTALALDNLAAGIPVVLIAPYTTERANPEAWRALHLRLERAGGTPLLVWLSLTPAEVLERLRSRAAVRDQAKLSDERAYVDRLSALTRPPAVPHLRVDARLPADVLATQVLDVLTRRNS